MNRKEEIEKGCGNTIVDRHYHQQGDCGLKGYLCPTCQARLDERIRAEQDFLRLIDEIVKKYDADYSATDFDTPYRVEDLIEELKSTIQKEKTK
jgi:hypothetical protein